MAKAPTVSEMQAELDQLLPYLASLEEALPSKPDLPDTAITEDEKKAILVEALEW